jgi:hypothetical protein
MSVNCVFCKKRKPLGTFFLKCSFARNCWAEIGVQIHPGLRAKVAVCHIKRSLNVPHLVRILSSLCAGAFGYRETHGFSTMMTPLPRTAKLPLKGNLPWSFIWQRTNLEIRWNHGFLSLVRLICNSLFFLSCCFGICMYLLTFFSLLIYFNQ